MALVQQYQKILDEQNKVQYFLSDITNHIMTITINRPERSNSFNPAMYLQMISLLQEAKDKKDVQVLLIKANGRNFSTGNDLKNMLEFDLDNPEMLSIWAYKAAQTVENLTNTLIDFPKPIIACVHGGTVGFMFTAMALFDMVLVTKDAYFQAPMVKAYQNTEMCGSFTFPRLFGTGKAFELLVLAKVLHAQEALELGYATQMYQTKELMYEAGTKLAKEMITFNQTCVSQAKDLMRSQQKEVLKDINKKECDVLIKAWLAPDFRGNLFKYLSSLKPKL